MRVLGWALIHFLWQGAAIGALQAAILAVVPRSTPRIRYAFGCAALVAMVCCLPLTVAYLGQVAPMSALPAIAAFNDADSPAAASSVLEAMRLRFEDYLPWLVAA
ncbi:MAG: hypothetical protein FJW27_19365 [Acidimicrobiia bacterium]|nr:hypothetical protein [Acidimicrobiia bacterium]